ncbi:MAG: hypothetical protein ACYDCQ_20545 [Dehalococcoidia bacterium]
MAHEMNDTTQVLLIAIGVAILVVVLLPFLFIGSMMSSMGSMMGGGAVWLLPLFLVLIVLIAGAALLAVGLRRR